MNIAVTGANGYIGVHVVNELLKRGQNVIAIDLINSKLDKNVKFYALDILQENCQHNFNKIFSSSDALIHLAWQDGFNHSAGSHIDNLHKHYQFLKNVIDSGCKSLIIMGSVHEIGYWEGIVDENTPCNPMSNYGVAKNALRQLMFQYCEKQLVNLKWLRGFYIYGDDKNNNSVFTKILEATQNGITNFPFTDGNAEFDFISIDELAKQIAVTALQNDVQGIINVCSGTPVAIGKMVENFIYSNNLPIALDYGKFPNRQYDSPSIYGDNSKIKKILKKDM
jgi:dTDP-6-deoxy-L-talose 4-dehydrogenase (NAD+)